MVRGIVIVGSANIDLIAYVPKFPAPGETIFGSRFEKGLGGKGANQAIAAARLNGVAGRVPVTFVGAVGDDAFGAEYAAAFASAGVAAYLTVVPGESTGVAPITVCTDGSHAGSNAIAVIPGANARLSAADVAAASPAAAISEAAAVLCQLEVGESATLAALLAARAAGAIAVLTPAPAPAGGLPPALFAATDVLVPNRGEALALSGVASCPAADDAPVPMPILLDAARSLLARGPRAIVVTCGGRGALVVGADMATWVPAVKPPALVDTTGAGDCFAGSLAHFYAAAAAANASAHTNGIDTVALVEAARRASVAAAFSVSRRGTQSSYPTPADLPSIFGGAAAAVWAPPLPCPIPAEQVSEA